MRFCEKMVHIYTIKRSYIHAKFVRNRTVRYAYIVVHTYMHKYIYTYMYTYIKCTYGRMRYSVSTVRASPNRSAPKS